MRFICSLIIYGLWSIRAFGTDSLKTLPGHVPAVVTRLTARGALSAANRMNLAIGLPLRNANVLDGYLAQLYDPASTNYHHYLTPEQFTAKFCPTEADYAAVVSFARLNHFTVNKTYGNRLLLDVNGSVADIQRAFHITLRTYRHPTQNRDFYAPDREPSVNASLSIADISGLNNFILPHPESHLSPSFQHGTTPESGSGPGGNYIGNDFRAAYLPDVFWNGSGQAVGMLEFDGFYPSDISSYETSAGLPSVPLQTVLLDGYNGVPSTGANSGNPEVSLDIEMAVSMAPGLSGIVVFEAGPFGLQNDVLNAMAASNQISQLSCSWGWGGGPSTTTDNIFKQMAAQGQSFFQASGDSDAYTTGSDLVNGVDNPSIANAPSSSPFITVVGGTTLSTTGAGGSWSSESVWNWGLDNGNYVGSSGGISSYYSIPDWQTNVSMASNDGSTTNRNLPDVALTADNIFVDYGDGNSGSFGGTSCATPLWAALTALMNEQSLAAGRTTVGFINPAVYALGNSTNYNECFHDITNGNDFSIDSPNDFSAVTGYDLCTGWGTPAGQNLISALAGQPDTLEILPATGFTATETELGDGLFRAASTTFQLTNSGAVSLNWSLINTSSWLQASLANGTLAVGGSTDVTVNLAAIANSLALGTYTANLQFTNWNTRVAQNFPFTLQVVQSLVQNGGFETGDFTDWTLVGNTLVANQTGETIYNAVESTDFYPQVVHSGNYGAFLGDTQVATLSQSLATIPGDNYLFSFWLDNPVSGATQIFQVKWDGNNLYSMTNPPAFSWTNFQFIATAAGNDTIQVGAENEPNFWGLDDVSVIHVPSPVLSIGRTATTFELGWNTATDLVYQVQYKTNLLQANWSNLTQPITPIGNSLAVTDAVSSQRFYRLLISP